MYKIKLDKLEYITGYKIKKNFYGIGWDIAERTGVCSVKTTDKEAIFDFSFIEFDKSEIRNIYKEMYNSFKENINNQDLVVIEDSFLQFFGRKVQADVFKKLTRFGTLALSVCLDKKVPHVFILAKSARAKLKIKMVKGQPKESVATWLKENLNLDLKGDTDASDSIILAILSILEGLDFKPTYKKKAKKRK